MDRKIRIEITVKITATFTIHVPGPVGPPALALSPNGGALPDEAVGQPATGKISISGGTPPYTPSVTAGSLPPGVSLTMDPDGTDIDIEGAPTTPGDYTFDVSVVDVDG